MTQVLLIVGSFVFLVSVYGVVVVGGHLLKELQRAELTPVPAYFPPRPADTGPPTKPI